MVPKWLNLNTYVSHLISHFSLIKNFSTQLAKNEFFYLLEEQIGKIEGRSFVDSAPVLDRAWARKSGLGWIGKNSMLINKQRGSDFFIAQGIYICILPYRK